MIEYLITGKLVFETALHIGTGKGNDAVDSLLRRAGTGQLLLSGRAIGGSLRTLATQLAPRLGFDPCHDLLEVPFPPRDSEIKPACQCVVCQLLGTVNPNERSDSESGGIASRVWVQDALAGGNQPTQVRDGVGIDRRSRTAARNVKFDQEIIPAGIHFPLHIRVQLKDDKCQDQLALLAAVLEEWKAGRGRVGGDAARGLGAFKLKDVQSYRQELKGNENLMSYLKAQEPLAGYQSKTNWLTDNLNHAKTKRQTVEPYKGGMVEIQFDLQFDLLSLINDPMTALLSGFDHAPHLDLVLPARGKPVLPGSTLRGILRSHAERIARTLATHYSWQQGNGDFSEARDHFYRHCPACSPLVIANENAPLASCDSRIASKHEFVGKALEERLCLGCWLFGSTRLGSRLWIQDGQWTKASFDNSDWKAQDFLAIDRFTGGGKEGAKFDAAALANAAFRIKLLLHQPADWELGWLALVLRDLGEGHLTVGFGRAKGYGRVTFKQLDYTFYYLTEKDMPNGASWLKTDGESGIYQMMKAAIQANHTHATIPFAAWVTAFNTKLKTLELKHELADDTFYTKEGESIYNLYGFAWTMIGQGAK